MKYPEIILLPILMFGDYYLTVLGAILKEKEHAAHFKMEHYELNPMWQTTIAQKRWFNPRHTLLTLLTCGILACLLECFDLPPAFAEVTLGCLLITYGMIVGRHFDNVLIFCHLNRNPQELSGQITMTHSLTLYLSMYQYLVAGIPILLLAIFSPTPFILGALLGVVMLFVHHLRWIQRHKRQCKS
jgi:hypothetical protein